MTQKTPANDLCLTFKILFESFIIMKIKSYSISVEKL